MSAETITDAPRAAEPIDWATARELVHRAGLRAAPLGRPVPLVQADRHTLAEPLVTLTDLPAFPTSSVDGWAVRGPGPWRSAGRILAGGIAGALTEDGTAVEIATGAMVPAGATAILRTEDAVPGGSGLIDGTPRPQPDWRSAGEEAGRGEELLPAGTPVDPGVIGLAASCGYDELVVRPRPRAALLVFGDELLTTGLPGAGRVRDALGPAVPGWLRRFGAVIDSADVTGPVQDTLDAHVDAIRAALHRADVVCTTGGTMHGPVDHLHPALRALGAEYVVNTVAVRPGFPMLLARLPGPDGRDRFLAGLPGNPQSAVIALVSLVAPLLAGLHGQAAAPLPEVTLAEPVPGRGTFTHLSLVRLDPVQRTARPVPHVGSAMLRGLARADGFAVIAPGTQGSAGDRVGFVPLRTGGPR